MIAKKLAALAMAACLAAKCALASASETYENGFPTATDFFPIGVWLQSPANAAKYKAIGINTFVALWEGPTEAPLAELAKQGMYSIAGQNEVGLDSVNRSVIKAWFHSDEPDNAQEAAPGVYGPCIPAEEVVRRSRNIKARDGTRPVFINFGRGVADPAWTGRGSCTGDEEYYPRAIDGADILSFDIYPVGSDTPREKGKLEYVARGVSNLAGLANKGQSVWAILETTALDPKRPITPAELRAEVWMALIHGAKGIAYFVHELAPDFREDAIFRYPEIVEEVSRIDATIAALAPVLHGPDVAGEVSVASSVPIAIEAKEHEGAVYIFAVAMRNEATEARFTIGMPREGSAAAIGEDRTVKIANGAFEDSFLGYGVHLYKIDVTRP